MGCPTYDSDDIGELRRALSRARRRLALQATYSAALRVMLEYLSRGERIPEELEEDAHHAYSLAKKVEGLLDTASHPEYLRRGAFMTTEVLEDRSNAHYIKDHEE